MSNQIIKQAVITAQPVVNPAQQTELISLFNEDGSPVNLNKAPSAAQIASVVLDPAVSAVLNPSIRLLNQDRRPVQPQAIKSMVQACSVGHGWVIGGDRIASSDLNEASASTLLGTQVCRATLNSTGDGQGAYFEKTLVAPIDAMTSDIRVWFQVDAIPSSINLFAGNANFATAAQVQAFGTSTATDLVNWPFQLNRWMVVDVPRSAFNTANLPNGDNVFTAIQRVRMQVIGKAGIPVNFRFGGWAFTQQNPTGKFPKGVCSITADDSFASQFSILRPAMDERGMVGTLMPILDKINTAGCLTDAQIAMMVANGWEVGAHAATNTHHAAGYPGRSKTQRLADLNAIRAWMDARGYRSNSFSWPLGNHDAASEADVSQFFNAGRLAFGPMITPQAPAQMFAIGSMNPGTQWANFQSWLNKTVASAGWIIITLHDVKASGASGNDITTANMVTMLDAIVTSGIAVRTMGQVLSAHS